VARFGSALSDRIWLCGLATATCNELQQSNRSSRRISAFSALPSTANAESADTQRTYSILTGALLLTIPRTPTLTFTLPASTSSSGTRQVTCDNQLKFFTRPAPSQGKLNIRCCVSSA